MSHKLNPYLNFKAQTKEVMEFYKNVFGGKLTMMTFKDSGMQVKPEEENNVMHAELIADNGMTIMSSDTPSEWPLDVGTNVSLSLSGDDTEALNEYWNKLSEGGNVQQPLVQASWGDTFGMLTDKFGIRWLVNISGKKS